MLTFRAGVPPVEKRPYKNALMLEIEAVPFHSNNSSPCPSQLPTPIDSPRSSVSVASGPTFAWSTKKENPLPAPVWGSAGLSSPAPSPLPLDLVPAFVIDQPRWENLQKQVSDQGCELVKLAQVAKRHSLENKILNQKYITLRERCDKVDDRDRTSEETRKASRKDVWTKVFWWLGFSAVGLVGWALGAAPILGGEHYYTPT